MWTGTLAVFALAISFFIFIESKYNNKLFNFLKYRTYFQLTCIIVSLLIGSSLLYASYKIYLLTKVNPLISYEHIYDYAKENPKMPKKCMAFYEDGNRGGFLLERFLASYSKHVIWTEELQSKKSLMVLHQAQCKANEILKSNKGSKLLLSTAAKVDADYYYKLGKTDIGSSYFLRFYDDWYMKALLISNQLKKRGDLLSPFLSYAINNGKTKDALKVCKNEPRGIEAFCELVKAYKILERKELNESDVKESIKLIKRSIDHGIFNELVPQFWTDESRNMEYLSFYGIKGIPLAPNIIFLISDEEKMRLEETLGYSGN